MTKRAKRMATIALSATIALNLITAAGFARANKQPLAVVWACYAAANLAYIWELYR